MLSFGPKIGPKIRTSLLESKVSATHRLKRGSNILQTVRGRTFESLSLDLSYLPLVSFYLYTCIRKHICIDIMCIYACACLQIDSDRLALTAFEGPETLTVGGTCCSYLHKTSYD